MLTAEGALLTYHREMADLVPLLLAQAEQERHPAAPRPDDEPQADPCPPDSPAGRQEAQPCR